MPKHRNAGSERLIICIFFGLNVLLKTLNVAFFLQCGTEVELVALDPFHWLDASFVSILALHDNNLVIRIQLILILASVRMCSLDWYSPSPSDNYCWQKIHVLFIEWALMWCFLCRCNRHLEHSTIIYEDPQHSPLLRLSWNKQDPNYLATFSLDAMEVGLL